MVAAIATLGLLLMGSGPQKKTSVKYGKPQAPVHIVGFMEAEDAFLALTFEAEAENVEIRVYGTGGLKVQSSDTPAAGGSYAAGQTIEISVDYTLDGERGDLAVSVSGVFAGGNRSTRVTSFSVGSEEVVPKETQKSNERNLIIMPAEKK
jgi:hypothetical protein